MIKWIKVNVSKGNPVWDEKIVTPTHEKNVQIHTSSYQIVAHVIKIVIYVLAPNCLPSLLRITNVKEFKKPLIFTKCIFFILQLKSWYMYVNIGIFIMNSLYYNDLTITHDIV